MGFNEFMTKLFGNKSQRDLKEITPYVDKVKAVYPSIKALSNDELRAKTDEIKQRIQDYVAEEKAQVGELRKGIEDKKLDVYHADRHGRQMDCRTNQICRTNMGS